LREIFSERDTRIFSRLVSLSGMTQENSGVRTAAECSVGDNWGRTEVFINIGSVPNYSIQG
jgi:hypothetical protein